MSTGTVDYLTDAAQLPAGNTLTFYDVPWPEYERLLEQLGDNSHRRVSYSNGRLEIMSPSNKHEKLKNLINSLVETTCFELDIEWLSLGSVTLKKRQPGKGVEADDCFYFAAARPLIRQDTLDLDSDPAPDIVVEIDITNQSLWKLEIYASFGVPEVCRYVKGRLDILKLSDGQYEPVSASQFLPVLTPASIIQFIVDCESLGNLQAQRKLRAWLESKRGSHPRGVEA